MNLKILTRSFLTAFLYCCKIYSSKRKFRSITTPRSFCFSLSLRGNLINVLPNNGLKTEIWTYSASIYCVKSIHIRSHFWSKYRKIWTRNNSVFRHFSSSDWFSYQIRSLINPIIDSIQNFSNIYLKLITVLVVELKKTGASSMPSFSLCLFNKALFDRYLMFKIFKFI